MGLDYRGICHANAKAVGAAFCSQEYPKVSGSGDQVAVTSCSVNPISSAIVLSQKVGTAAATQVSISPQFGACDPAAPYTDVMTVFGLGLAAVAVTWACKQFWFKLLSNQ